MKQLPIVLLSFVLFLSIPNLSAQSGWNTGNYYSSRGTTDVSCGGTYTVQKTDGYNYWNEGWKNCRKRIWYQEYYSGYVNLWGSHGWYSEWRQGNYWYFTWYDYQVRDW